MGEASIAVLNAFRHLRGVHLRVRRSAITFSAVLNAFRHLRGVHPREPYDDCQHITVLNAFRHLRGVHNPTTGEFRRQACR